MTSRPAPVWTRLVMAYGLGTGSNPRLIGFNALLKLGEDYGKANAGVFEQNINSGRSDDTAFIFYTLNGKGLPKGAVMTHKALISSAEGLRLRFPVQPEDHLMAALPAASGENSYFAALLHLLSGAALNYPETPETTVADTRETGPDFAAYNAGQWENLASAVKTRIKGSNPVARFFYQALFPAGNNPAGLKLKSKKPNLFRRLWNLPADRLFFAPLKDKTGLSHTRFAVNYSGTPLSKETIRLMYTLGVEIRQTYSLAETGLIAGQSPAENDFDTTGRPTLDTEIRIMADGEMLVRSSGMFRGYYNDPSATAAVLQDGWYYSGDAGYMDDEGFVFIEDRLKDMIISGGENIYPAEVEKAIEGHPRVAAAAVIGVADEKWGEVGKAVLELKPGEELALEELQIFLNDRLGKYKIPKYAVVVKDLPRTAASGKVQKFILKEKHGKPDNR